MPNCNARRSGRDAVQPASSPSANSGRLQQPKRYRWVQPHQHTRAYDAVRPPATLCRMVFLLSTPSLCPHGCEIPAPSRWQITSVPYPRAPVAPAQMVPWFPSGPNSHCPPRPGHPRGPPSRGLTRGPPCRPPTWPPSRAPLSHPSHVAPRPVRSAGAHRRGLRCPTSRGLSRGVPYRAHPLYPRPGVTRAPVPGTCMLPRPGLQWAAAPVSPVVPRHRLPRTHPPLAPPCRPAPRVPRAPPPKGWPGYPCPGISPDSSPFPSRGPRTVAD